MYFPRVSNNMQDTHGTYAEEPVLYGADDYHGDEHDSSSDDAAGDVTIMPDKGKGREVDSEQGPATQSVLSGIDLEPFRSRVSSYDPTTDYKLNALAQYQGDGFGRISMDTEGQTIPSDPDAIMSHYNSSHRVKRSREVESVESRQSKIHRRSTSHSAPSAEHSTGHSVPLTPLHISRDQSPSPLDSERYGASRTTGGVFGGRAVGNAPNWGDMEVDGEVRQQTIGKVLLYTSQERDAHPAMTIKHQTTSELPSILDKLAQKFSPIRSKYIIFYQFYNS
jgi:hypothetical protein